MDRKVKVRRYLASFLCMCMLVNSGIFPTGLGISYAGQESDSETKVTIASSGNADFTHDDQSPDTATKSDADREKIEEGIILSITDYVDDETPLAVISAAPETPREEISLPESLSVILKTEEEEEMEFELPVTWEEADPVSENSEDGSIHFIPMWDDDRYPLREGYEPYLFITVESNGFPSLDLLYTGEEKAASFLFADGSTEEVESLLGREVSGAHGDGWSLFSLFRSDPDYRFSMYYIMYKNNYATTKTDSVQDLLGNCEKTKQLIKCQFDFHSDVDYSEGEVEIRIPYVLYEDRYGNDVVFSDIGVPESPHMNKSSSFNYTLEDVNGKTDIVFRNCKPIVAGSNDFLQIFYALNDMATIDGTAWDISPELTVKGAIEDTGVQLTGSMDTSPELTFAQIKPHVSNDSSIYPELYTVEQVENALTGINGRPISLPQKYRDNFDNYYYILWRTEINGYSSQPWDLKMQSIPSNDGEVIGQYVGEDGRFYSPEVSVFSFGDVLEMKNRPRYGFGPFRGDDHSEGRKGKEMYLYTVAAYEKAEVPDKQLGNTVKLTMTGIDDHIEHTLETTAAHIWAAYEWHYQGDIIGVDKAYGATFPFLEDSWKTVYSINKEKQKDTVLPHSWNIRGVMRGYDLICPKIEGTNDRIDLSDTVSYTLWTMDDFQYLNDRKMGPEDYYYDDIKIKLYNYGIDIYENRTFIEEEGEPVKISVITADGGNQWQEVAEVPYKEVLADGGYRFPQEWLDRGIYRIKVEQTANDYEINCDIYTNTVLRHDSPLAAQLIEEGAQKFTIQNLGAVMGTCTAVQGWIQDTSDDKYNQYNHLHLKEDTLELYGTLVQRDNAYATLTELQEANSILKTGTAKNNTLNSTVDLTYQVTAYDGYQVYGQTGIDSLKDAGIRVGRTSGVIYDLLPLGVKFDPTAPVKAGALTEVSEEEKQKRNVSGNWDDAGVSVDYRVTEDYHGSGRQMVTFIITSETANEKSITRNVPNSQHETRYWFSGWGVEFGAYYEWKDMDTCNGAINVSAYQTPDDTLKGSAHNDSGRDAPSEAHGYIYDLDEDGDTTERNVLYTTCAVSLDNAVAARAEIRKTVKEDANIYGVTDKDANVQPGKTYTYDITVLNGNNKLNDLVIFDNLENAPERRADKETRVFEDNYWYGSFVKTNTEALEDRGIDVKVYFSENRAEEIQIAGKSGQEVLETGGWTPMEDWNRDYSEVKSVAYDLTQTQEGDPYTLLEMETLMFTITMKAPDSMQNKTEGSNEAAKDPSAPAVYAYNNPSYYATISQVGMGSTADTVTGNSTGVRMYGETRLSVEKTEITGEGAPEDEAFGFEVTVDGKPYDFREYILYDRDVPQPGLRATDARGILYLKVHQRAEFLEVPAERLYEVKELGSIRWESHGTNAVGLLRSGETTKVEFTNDYHPTMYFEKKVNGTVLSEDKNDEFTFRLTIDGRPAAGNTYYLVDPSEPLRKEPVLLSGPLKTGADGLFTLKGGQRICIRGNQGEVYRFEEIDGYGAGTNYECQKPETEVVLASPYTYAEIVNSYKWKTLEVTKTVTTKEDGVVDKTQEFPFTVSVAGHVLANYNYLLRDENGRLVSGTWKTDDTGSFTLKANQTAVFERLLGESQYEIRESKTDGYDVINPSGGVIQGTLPKYAEGSKVKFENRSKLRDLIISKEVHVYKEDEAPRNKQFQFTLEIDGNPYGTQLYKKTSASGSVTEQQTGADGTFTLKDGESARFLDLDHGSTYKVTENLAGDDYYQEEPLDNKPAEGTIGETLEPTEVKFVNGTKSGQERLVIQKKLTFEDANAADEYNRKWSLKNINYIIAVKVNGGPYTGRNTYIRQNGDLYQEPVPEKQTADETLYYLKAGESVILEDVNAGDTYEVRELYQAIENYIIKPVFPENYGTLQGTVKNRGNGITVINELSVKFSSPEKHLWLCKKIGENRINDMKAIEHPEYIGSKLTLQLLEKEENGDWMPAEGIAYQLVDLHSNGTHDDYIFGKSGMTGVDGKFQMEGYECKTGYIAGFSAMLDIPADNFSLVDNYPIGPYGDKNYKVVEVKEESDPVLGDFLGVYLSGRRDGVYTFEIIDTSAETSFKVYKEAVTPDGELPEQTFIFEMTKIPTLNYWLDTSKEERVSGYPYRIFETESGEEITDGGPFITDEQGRFGLKAGQYALFDNVQTMEKTKNNVDRLPYFGTYYRVREIVPEGYSLKIEPEGVKVEFVDMENAYRLNLGSNEEMIAPGFTTGMKFINSYEPEPSLSIIKQVVSEQGHPVGPMDDFTFTLKVDGRPYARQTYLLYDGQGQQIKNYVRVDGTNIEVPWETDSYGDFTLKHGQKAVFPWIGVGKKYEITEEPLTGYTQMSPAYGTSAQGVMTELGKTEIFQNYRGTSGAFIRVKKNISIPSGLEFPEESFLFALEVDGVEYSMKPYHLYEKDGKPVSGNYYTDSMGQFRLGAGQYAIFSDVPVGVDYEVTEIPETGSVYRLIGSNGTAGATTESGVTAEFINGSAGFLITKEVTSLNGQNTPEGDEFTFTVKTNGIVLANTEYRKYDFTGTCMEGTWSTDASGNFSLKAGEKALFMGLPEGTPYEVQEQVKPQYSQVVPLDGKGYTGTADNTVAVLTFQNRYAGETSLKVSKKVVGYEADVPSDTRFTFQITINGILGVGRTYKLSSDGSAHQTDEQGIFYLKSGESAVFEGLLAGEKCKVVEKDVPAGYIVKNPDGVVMTLKSNLENHIIMVNSQVPTIWVENTTGDDTEDKSDDNLGGRVAVEGIPESSNTVSSDGGDDNSKGRYWKNAVTGTPESGWTVDLDGITIGLRKQGVSGADKKISSLPHVGSNPSGIMDFYNTNTGEFRYTAQSESGEHFVLTGQITEDSNGAVKVEFKDMMYDIDVGIPFKEIKKDAKLMIDNRTVNPAASDRTDAGGYVKEGTVTSPDFCEYQKNRTTVSWKPDKTGAWQHDTSFEIRIYDSEKEILDRTPSSVIPIRLLKEDKTLRSVSDIQSDVRQYYPKAEVFLRTSDGEITLVLPEAADGEKYYATEVDVWFTATLWAENMTADAHGGTVEIPGGKNAPGRVNTGDHEFGRDPERLSVKAKPDQGYHVDKEKLYIRDYQGNYVKIAPAQDGSFQAEQTTTIAGERKNILITGKAGYDGDGVLTITLDRLLTSTDIGVSFIKDEDTSEEETTESETSQEETTEPETPEEETSKPETPGGNTPGGNTPNHPTPIKPTVEETSPSVVEAAVETQDPNASLGDSGIPLGGRKGSAGGPLGGPGTGDDSSPLIPIAFGLAITGLIVLTWIRRRRREE